MVLNEIDIFDDYNKDDRIKIVFDPALDSSKGSFTKEVSVFGIYTNEYVTKHNAYVYLDFKGWVNSSGVIVKPSSLVVTLRKTTGEYVRSGLSKVIYDENGLNNRVIKTDYFVFDPVEKILDFKWDTVFSKYWLTDKNIDNGFFNKFLMTHGLKNMSDGDLIDRNISKTGLDIHITKTSDGLKSNYDGSHNLGSGTGSGTSVINIDTDDYINGLENETLGNNLYNIIDKPTFKTEKTSVLVKDIGSRGIFQTDNKVYLFNGDNAVSIDKNTDEIVVIDSYTYKPNMYSRNMMFVECEDHFVVYIYDSPGYLIEINKVTDSVHKVGINRNLNDKVLAFTNRDGETGRIYPSQINKPLINDRTIWGLSDPYRPISVDEGGYIYSIPYYTFSIIEEMTLEPGKYYFASGAAVGINKELYIPFKETNDSPVTKIAKFDPNNVLPTVTIDLPISEGLIVGLMNPIIYDKYIIYPACERANNDMFKLLMLDTTTDTFSDSGYIPLQIPLKQSSITMFYDELRETIYIAHYGVNENVTFSYYDLANKVTYINPHINIEGVYNIDNPIQIKRIDDDHLAIQTPLEYRNGLQEYIMTIVTDGSTGFTEVVMTSEMYYSPQKTQSNYMIYPDFFDADENYIYAKPYGATDLFKIDKSTGLVEYIVLPVQSSYETGPADVRTESITVLGNNHVLILPGWEYINGKVYNIFDNLSLTQGKTKHSLNSTAGVIKIINDDKIYMTNTFPLGVQSTYSNVYLERAKKSGSFRLSYIFDHEEAPYRKF